MITGAILARDEERHIADCIASLRPHVAEIILIDMESRDRTVEIATPIVDQILTHPIIANFDVARNLAIDAAKYDWIWYLDADERIPPETGQQVNELVRKRGGEFVAITLPFRSQFAGRWIEHSGWWPGYTMPRVLRRGHFQFGERLHSGVQFSGPEFRFPPNWDLAIEHYSYDSLAHYVEKFNRYTSTEAMNLAEENVPLDWEQGLRALMKDLWLYYEKNEGQQDGFHGWVLAWLAGQYRWMSHAKILDARFPHQGEVPAGMPPSLDAVLDVLRSELIRRRNFLPPDRLGIVWRSPLFDPSGYAEDSRTYVKALSRIDRPMMVEDLVWSDRVCELPTQDLALYRSLLNGRRASGTIGITCTIPSLAAPDPDSCLNVLRTTFETDRIPPGWLDRIEQFDEVWLMAESNRAAFVRGGVAEDKLQIVPGYVDTDLFSSRGSKRRLPEALQGRFVFLSIFDWQLRKGWDVLLQAYCTTFAVEDNVGLLLKISRSHGHTVEQLQQQITECLQAVDVDFSQRSDIVLLDELLESRELASLYRSADAFVLASRGEGWGRPYMEAMACGLPTIGTSGSGQSDFMSADNSFLIEATLVDVPSRAVAEIPVYAGHRWLEPSREHLAEQLQLVVQDTAQARRRALKGRRRIQKEFSIEAGTEQLEAQLVRVERRVKKIEQQPIDQQQVRVQWEGEYFASHSFANINEHLTLQLGASEKLALSVDRVLNQPPIEERSERCSQIKSFFDRPLGGPPQVVVRHAFPPNWKKPEGAKWVHIQPWEFGYLPRDWVPPLADEVDEIWAPSSYVKQVYVDSGIARDKIQVIPWGVDADVYSPQATALQLKTDKPFRFLFVGGSIERKGCDTLLQAYLEEFGPSDDVCLVVKDIGTRTFYRYGNLRQEILAARDDPDSPQIEYLERDMAECQRASLYRSCQCLVAPYRGEGFGLPILEGMACGLPAIVPQDGASDDFVDSSTGFLLPSKRVECEHGWRLCGPGWELEIDVTDLRKQMRWAYENQDAVAQTGRVASQVVRQQFTWQQTAQQMETRIVALAQQDEMPNRDAGEPVPRQATLSACVLAGEDEQVIGDCLSRLRPFAEEILVGVVGRQDRTREICQEYAARVLELEWEESFSKLRNRLLSRATKDWVLSLDANEFLDDGSMQRIREFIAAAPPQVQGGGMVVTSADRERPLHESDVRVFRNQNEILFARDGCDTVEDAIVGKQGQIVHLPIFLVAANGEYRPDARVHGSETRRRLLHLDYQRESNNASVCYRLGRWHLLEGNPFHAECYLAEAHRRLSPEHPQYRETLRDLATAHQKKGDLHRAIEVTSEALEHCPDERFEKLHQSLLQSLQVGELA